MPLLRQSISISKLIHRTYESKCPKPGRSCGSKSSSRPAACQARCGVWRRGCMTSLVGQARGNPLADRRTDAPLLSDVSRLSRIVGLETADAFVSTLGIGRLDSALTRAMPKGQAGRFRFSALRMFAPGDVLALHAAHGSSSALVRQRCV